MDKNPGLEEKKRIASAIFLGFNSKDTKSLTTTFNDETSRIVDHNSSKVSEAGVLASDRYKGASQLSQLAGTLSMVKNTNESDLINLSMENININEEKQLNLGSDNEYAHIEEPIDVKGNQLVDLDDNSNLSSVNTNLIFDRPVENLLDDLTESKSSVEREIFPADILLNHHGSLDVLVSTN